MKFSILIPVHNGEDTLPHAMESILQQEFADFEAVVVNDGSTDGTGQLAERLAGQDRRIRVVHQPNGGVASARNRAMDEARGDWILWLDADDAYTDGAFGKIAALTEQYSACNCMQFPYQERKPDGTLQPCIPEAYVRYGGQVHSGQQAFGILFARNGIVDVNWQPWRFVFRRDSLPRFRAGIIHEDIDALPLHMASHIYKSLFALQSL